MAIFGPKPWVNLFRKMSFFLLFSTCFFYSLEKRFFVLEYNKRQFIGLYCLKKKLEKMPFLDQNHEKMKKCQFFDFLNLLFLQPRKPFFLSRISSKTFSWPLLPKKKKLEKWLFLDPNHRLIRMEKCQFFDRLIFLFLQPRKAFFLSRISLSIFSWPLLPDKKRWKNGHFWTKTMG